MPTVPQVLYKTPYPHREKVPSELYKINGVALPAATDPVKRWVLHEEHGYWDEQEKTFKSRATTFLPNDQQLCVSLEEVYEQIGRQVMVRVQSGFKYQLEWDPFIGPPFFRMYEIQPDGSKKEYS
jgi:hypothetical protein